MPHVSNLDAYRQLAADATNAPDAFWLKEANARLVWKKPPTLGCSGTFSDIKDGPLAWFGDGRLNITETCLDQHLGGRADKTAIIWESDDPGVGRSMSYRELHDQVCRAANALRGLGVKKGERVIIYMGMIPEAAVAMLACARLGAVHSVVFGGFSAEAIADRARDSEAQVIVTQDTGFRGGKKIPLKATVDEAVARAPSVEKVVVVKRTDDEVEMTDGRDVWWHDVVATADAECDAVECAAEDPLFILYTSGSTGKPKGLLHTQAGYMTYASFTHETVFGLREDDVYACVADVGWITGHSYIVYGPLANGATTVMFESVPTYPDAGRYWDLVERHKVNIFYTAPTALRALAAHGEGPVREHDTSSLRVLGTVGEPIDHQTWRWYHEVVGQGRCTVVDTWWQTETGGIAISPIAPATPTKPGSATLPMPGISPSLRDANGVELHGPEQGMLCIDTPWPGQARTIWGDHARFVGTYFSFVDGAYFTGDGARRDSDGYYWITGRVDDVINVSGHRMGTAEFESVLDGVERVAEAAVVGFPHDLKGQGVFAYLVMQPGEDAGADILAEVNAACRERIGAHAKIDRCLVVPGLPKTRSGKVMRRILRKIAEGRAEELGDTSTLADPGVVSKILALTPDLAADT